MSKGIQKIVHNRYFKTVTESLKVVFPLLVVGGVLKIIVYILQSIQ